MGHIYVLIEDCVSTAHSEMWDLINKNIYHNCLYIEPCSGLFKAKNKFFEIYDGLSLEEKESSIFLFVLDNVFDNYRVERALEYLHKYIFNVYSNTYLLPILCFENILLSVKDLDKWIFCDDYRELERTKEHLKILYDYNNHNWESSEEILKCFHHNCFSSEHLACSVLSKITSNTNFHVSKRELGLCWKIGCDESDCPYLKGNNVNIPLNKRCGLWEHKLTLEEKVKKFYKDSSLNECIKESKDYFLSKNFDIANELVVF